MIDEKKIKEGVKLLLEGIGEDVEREGLKDTPDRIARMYTEIFAGYEDSARDQWKCIPGCPGKAVTLHRCDECGSEEL